MNNPNGVWFMSSLPCLDNKVRLCVSKRRWSLKTVFWHKIRQAHAALIRDTSLCEKLPNHTAAAKGGSPISLSVCLGEVLLVAFLVGTRVRGTVLWFWACFSAPELLFTVPQPLRAFFCIALTTAMSCYKMHTLYLLMSAWKEGNRLFTLSVVNQPSKPDYTLCFCYWELNYKEMNGA